MTKCNCEEERGRFIPVSHTDLWQCLNCLTIHDLSTPINEAPPCKNPSFWRVMLLELRIVKRWRMTPIV